MNNPLLTFICPCYNHKNYVAPFINSVLGQSSARWRLIITDDGSTDGTPEEIKKFTADKRITLIENPYNRGINYSFSAAYKLAQTEIISFIASDDILYPGYIETIMPYFNDPKTVAVQPALDHMDETGKPLKTRHLMEKQKLYSREKFFQSLFLCRNQITGPGLAFRKAALAPYWPFNQGLINTHDWQMNMFLSFDGEIKITDTPLARYRRSLQSASAARPDTALRESVETPVIMATPAALIGEDLNLFYKFFGDSEVVKNKKIDARTIPFWLGRIALTSKEPQQQKCGLAAIMDFISAAGNMELLNALYGFTFKDYMNLAALIPYTDKFQRKAKKYKTISAILGGLVLLLAFILCLKVFI
ncbi:MAG: glycosyltransferase [Elusimicrobiota bacterium]|jgi:glycosyltransferase involved in cell wall biosynthesis|nr:glycosyltransferase [Elusimicrobiota bacterium]